MGSAAQCRVNEEEVPPSPERIGFDCLGRIFVAKTPRGVPFLRLLVGTPAKESAVAVAFLFEETCVFKMGKPVT